MYSALGRQLPYYYWFCVCVCMCESVSLLSFFHKVLRSVFLSIFCAFVTHTDRFQRNRVSLQYSPNPGTPLATEKHRSAFIFFFPLLLSCVSSQLNLTRVALLSSTLFFSPLSSQPILWLVWARACLRCLYLSNTPTPLSRCTHARPTHSTRLLFPAIREKKAL